MNGYFDYIGLPIEEDESARLIFTIERKHLNGGGSIHGGMTMTLAERVCRQAVAASLENRAFTCVSLNCAFVSGAGEGETVTCEAEVSRQTSALLFVSASLASGDRTVMTASGLYAVEPDA